MKFIKIVTSYHKLALCSFFSFFFLEFIISYQQIFKIYGGCDSDVLSHIAFISLIGKFNFPQMGFEYSVFILSKLCFISYQWATILLLSISIGAQGFFTFYLLVKLTKTSQTRCFIYSIFLLICSAIYIPYFNYSLNLNHVNQQLNHFFLVHPQTHFIQDTIAWLVKFCAHYALWGVGSPNVWHNPTYILIKIISLVLFYIYINSNNIRELFFVSVVLAISCFYKPSFAMIFIPAAIVFEFIKGNLSFYEKAKRLGLLILPSFLLLIIMSYILTHVYRTPTGEETHIIYAPFSVIHLFVKYPIGALVESLTFPVLILLFRYKSIINDNPYLTFSWLMIMFGYLYWALLAQSGSFFYSSANFVWGYDLGLAFVFTFSIVEYLRSQFANNKVKLIINGSLILHLSSGIYYLIKILFNIPAV